MFSRICPDLRIGNSIEREELDVISYFSMEDDYPDYDEMNQVQRNNKKEEKLVSFLAATKILFGSL